MPGRKRIDLLKISAADQSRAIEAKLGEPGGKGTERLFPRDFAANGPNVPAIRYSEVRAQAKD